MVSTRRSKSHRTQAHNSKSRRKCLRPGPIGRNPYLNFLREFRKKCCGMTPTKTVQQGAKAWKSLNKEGRLRYISEAFYAPKRRRLMRRPAARMSRSKSRSTSRRKSTGRSSSPRKARQSRSMCGL